MSEYTVADMIGNVLEKQPNQFKSTFNDLMVDKITAALEIKKQEVAQNYFATSEEGSEDSTTELETETEEQDGQDSETDA
jgi:hypothetical protein